MVLPATSKVARKESYVFVHTQERPDFVWGNYILMIHDPQIQQFTELVKLWLDEFASHPEVDTVAITWESGLASTEVYVPHRGSRLPHSFDLTAGTVMQAEASTVRYADDVSGLLIHPVEGSAMWSELEALWITNLGDGSAESSDFLSWRVESYRSLIDAGRGEWWGAWAEGTLCGTAGLFWGDGVGSFQEVVTHAPYRRQGIASRLCSQMASAFFESNPAGNLVVVAERNSVAERVYRRLGFRPTTLQWNLTGPRSDLSE